MTYFLPTKTYSMILWNWCSHFYFKYLIMEWKCNLVKDVFSVPAPFYNRHKTSNRKNFLWHYSKVVTWSPSIKQGTLLLCRHELVTLTLPETITYMIPCQNIGIYVKIKVQLILELLDLGFPWIKFQSYKSLSLFQPDFKYSL